MLQPKPGLARLCFRNAAPSIPDRSTLKGTGFPDQRWDHQKESTVGLSRLAGPWQISARAARPCDVMVRILLN